MTCSEVYDAIGGSYEDALSRLMNDKLITKFLLKFPADPSYSQLCDSMKAGDMATAFRAAHTLKGVSRNLSLQLLGNAADVLTEALRDANASNTSPEALEAMLKDVSIRYDEAIAAISQLA